MLAFKDEWCCFWLIFALSYIWLYYWTYFTCITWVTHVITHMSRFYRFFSIFLALSTSPCLDNLLHYVFSNFPSIQALNKNFFFFLEIDHFVKTCIAGRLGRRTAVSATSSTIGQCTNEKFSHSNGYHVLLTCILLFLFFLGSTVSPRFDILLHYVFSDFQSSQLFTQKKNFFCRYRPFCQDLQSWEIL